MAAIDRLPLPHIPPPGCLLLCSGDFCSPMTGCGTSNMEHGTWNMETVDVVKMEKKRSGFFLHSVGMH
jgi:hypothetical protein